MSILNFLLPLTGIAQKQHSKSQRTTSHESNASSRGMIPKARIKTIKMTLAIVSGESLHKLSFWSQLIPTDNLRAEYLKSCDNIFSLWFAVFIFCWVPYFIFDLMDVYGHIPRTKRQMAVAIFIQSLTTLNSAANPIIYFIFSKTQCSPTRYVCWYEAISFNPKRSMSLICKMKHLHRAMLWQN